MRIDDIDSNKMIDLGDDAKTLSCKGDEVCICKISWKCEEVLISSDQKGQFVGNDQKNTT